MCAELICQLRLSGFSLGKDSAINYVSTVANTGNTTLTDVTVTDPYADAGSIVRGVDVSGDNDDLLEVGETWGYTATHTVTQDEIDSNGGGDGLLENTATADSAETGEDTDGADVPIDLNPAINIDKVTVFGSTFGDGLTGIHVGDAIGWRYTVTNTGNVALSDVVVRDDHGTPGDTSDDFFATYVSGDTDNDSKLDLTETWIFTANGTAVSGTYTNTGYVSGMAADEQQATDTDLSSYTAIPREALIAPTNTTPYQYISGTAMSFQDYYAYQGGVIQYSVKSGKISQTNPGVFFYFTGASGDIDGVDANNDGNADQMTVTIDQTMTPDGTTSAFNPLNLSNIQLYKVIDDGDGVVDAGDSLATVSSKGYSVSIVNGDVSITFTPDAVGSMYVIGVKYQTSSVVGNSVTKSGGVYPTVNYNFDTVMNGSIIETYDGGVDLAPKPNTGSKMLLSGDGGDGAHAANDKQVNVLAKAAMAWWAAQGQDVSTLADVSVDLSDLGQDGDGKWILGVTNGNEITLDDDGAGLGWSTGVGGVAPNKVDMLSVLVHEMGHVLGMTDEQMGDMLAVGDRMVPGGEAEGGADDAVASLPDQADQWGMVGIQQAEHHVNFS